MNHYELEVLSTIKAFQAAVQVTPITARCWNKAEYLAVEETFAYLFAREHWILGFTDKWGISWWEISDKASAWERKYYGEEWEMEDERIDDATTHQEQWAQLLEAIVKYTRTKEEFIEEIEALKAKIYAFMFQCLVCECTAAEEIMQPLWEQIISIQFDESKVNNDDRYEDDDMWQWEECSEAYEPTLEEELEREARQERQARWESVCRNNGYEMEY